MQQGSTFQGVRWLTTDAISTDLAETWRRPALGAGTLALIQYTSGSTAAPKGVKLSHANLLHNSGLIAQELPDLHHYNQALLLELDQPLNPTLLESALHQMPLHHDALRMRFVCTESGWQQINSLDAVVPCHQVDLAALADTEQAAAMTRVAATVHASLNLAEGPLVRVVLFNLGAHKPGRLLLIIHHLVVDAASWRILLEDFQTTYGQLSRGAALALPPKTSAFKQWAERLMIYAQSDALQNELADWLVTPAAVPRLPVDDPAGMAANTAATARRVSMALNADETRALLQEVPGAYHTQINDVLLAALALAFARWTGTPALLVDLEGHGREPLFDDLDLSRTVGWFTIIFPVLLDLRAATQPGKALQVVKEQLRRIPNHGLGYGVLRYLRGNPVISGQLRALPQTEVSFNYLGQMDQVLPETGPLRLASETSGPLHSPRGRRSYLLEVSGFVSGGLLHLNWTYSTAVHRRTTIEELAQECMDALRALIAHCQAPDAGGYTPSDFPDVALSQEELEDLMTKISGV